MRFLFLFLTILVITPTFAQTTTSEPQVKTPVFSVGMQWYQINTSPLYKGSRDVSDYSFECGIGCSAAILNNDQDFIYFISNNTVDKILLKKDLDDKKLAIENRMKNENATYQSEMLKKRSEVKSKIDVVAQVLNYSSGCNDDGCGSYSSWVVKDSKNCIYEKIDIKSGSVMQTINLNDMDPKSIKITSNEVTTSTPTERVENWGRQKYRIFGTDQNTYETQNVMYMGKPIFTQQNLDITRLKRGWTLIYSKYCSGTKKAF